MRFYTAILALGIAAIPFFTSQADDLIPIETEPLTLSVDSIQQVVNDSLPQVVSDSLPQVVSDSIAPQPIDTIVPQPIDTIVPQPIDTIVPQPIETVVVEDTIAALPIHEQAVTKDELEFYNVIMEYRRAKRNGQIINDTTIERIADAPVQTTTPLRRNATYADSNGELTIIDDAPYMLPEAVQEQQLQQVQQPKQPRKKMKDRFYEYSGKNYLAIIGAGYTYSCKDHNHILQATLFEGRAKCFGISLLNFEMGFSPWTRWIGYKPTIKIYIPAYKWVAVCLYGGMETDMSYLRQYVDKKFEFNYDEDYFLNGFAGISAYITIAKYLPIELAVEYRHPVIHKLQPQGVYLSTRVYLGPITKRP